MRFVITLIIVFLLSSCGIDDTIDGNDGDTGSGSGWEKEWGNSVLGLQSVTVSNNTVFVGGDRNVTVDWNYAIAAFSFAGEEMFYKFGESGGSIHSLIVNSEGSLYAVGSENWNSILMKISKDGDEIWKIVLREEESSEAYDVALDSNENVFVAYNDIKYSGENGIIKKFSPEGKALWNHKISSAEEKGHINTLVVDSKGNIYAGGITWDNLFEDNVGETDVFLVKIAPDGTHVWEKQWGSNNQDRLYALAIDDSDNIYVAGGTHGTTEILLKFSSDGKKIWGNEGTGINYQSLALDSENNIYVGVGENHNLVDKYNSNGEKIWSSDDEGKWDWGATGVALDSNNNLYVCGGTTENHLIKIPASEMK